jgi:hypothetical protein
MDSGDQQPQQTSSAGSSTAPIKHVLTHKEERATRKRILVATFLCNIVSLLLVCLIFCSGVPASDGGINFDKPTGVILDDLNLLSVRIVSLTHPSPFSYGWSSFFFSFFLLHFFFIFYFILFYFYKCSIQDDE